MKQIINQQAGKKMCALTFELGICACLVHRRTHNNRTKSGVLLIIFHRKEKS